MSFSEIFPLHFDDAANVGASLLPRKVEAEISGPTHEDRVAERARLIAEYEEKHGPVPEALN